MARKNRKNLPQTVEPVQVEQQNLTQVAAYLRLSADDTRKKGNSLENQQSIIERYLAGQPDLQLSGVYTDTDKTGTNFNRPGFQQMLADIEAGKIGCIAVKDLTRFGRNAIDAGYYLEKYLPEKGVRFIAINDHYDSLEGDGGIMLPIKNILAESYALDIGRKCRSVWRQHMLLGHYIGRIAPYGYRKDPSDCHKLLVDPETAPVVQDIFTWVSEGMSIAEVSRRLNFLSVPSPRDSMDSKKSAEKKEATTHSLWSRRTVHAILIDTVYVGDLVQGKTEKIHGKQRAVPREAWISVSDTHEPLISRALFDDIAKLLKQNQEKAAVARRLSTPHTENILTGKIICAHCGYAMARKRQNSDGIYWYRCESQQNYGKQSCTVVSIKEAELVNVLLMLFHEQNRLITGRYQSLVRASVSATEDTELTLTRRDISKLQRITQSLYESLVTEVISPEEYRQMKEDYAEKLKTLKEKAGDLQEQKRQRNTDIETFSALSEAVEATLADRKLTAKLMEHLVQKIEVHPDKSATIHLNYQDVLQEVAAVG